MTIFTDKDNYISDGRDEMKSEVVEMLIAYMEDYHRNDRVNPRAIILNIIEKVENL
jgi:hypothetical protein